MRLNPNNPDTLKKLHALGLKSKLVRRLNSGVPIDVCMEDYYDEGFSDDVPHPDYTQGNYTCFICGCVLALEDDSRVAGV